TVIVVLSLGVSPWIAVLSLGFLVVVHKLEYFLNAQIVGHRIRAAAWEILLAIILFEVAFGVPGVILAPVVYAYAKNELHERGLVCRSAPGSASALTRSCRRSAPGAWARCTAPSTRGSRGPSRSRCSRARTRRTRS